MIKYLDEEDFENHVQCKQNLICIRIKRVLSNKYR